MLAWGRRRRQRSLDRNSQDTLDGHKNPAKLARTVLWLGATAALSRRRRNNIYELFTNVLGTSGVAPSRRRRRWPPFETPPTPPRGSGSVPESSIPPPIHPRWRSSLRMEGWRELITVPNWSFTRHPSLVTSQRAPV